MPPLFRKACEEAARGGGEGYALAGRILLHHIPKASQGEFSDVIDSDREDDVVEWLERNAPACLVLVPTRRRSSFVRGLFRAWADFDEEFVGI